jgi:hypothetical protein
MNEWKSRHGGGGDPKYLAKISKIMQLDDSPGIPQVYSSITQEQVYHRESIPNVVKIVQDYVLRGMTSTVV